MDPRSCITNHGWKERSDAVAMCIKPVSYLLWGTFQSNSIYL
jgi:hypothetical protein